MPPREEISLDASSSKDLNAPPLNAPGDWWKDFFTGLAMDFWRVAVPPEVTRAEADFLWRRLRLAPGARVLDVPSGAGRALDPRPAARGATVTGVDASEEALTAARDDAARERADVAWVPADMRRLPGGVPVDAAFCFGKQLRLPRRRRQPHVPGVRVVGPRSRRTVRDRLRADARVDLSLGSCRGRRSRSRESASRRRRASTC